MHLTKDAILQAQQGLRRVQVDVPEWGGLVYVAELTGRQRDALDTALDEHRDDEGKIKSLAVYRALIVIHTVVDAEGCRVFGPDDLDRLLKFSSRPMERIRIAADAINGLTAEEIEVIRKNCGSPVGPDSGSSSPTDGAAQ